MSSQGRGLQKHSTSYIQAKNNGFGNPSAARPKSPSEELTDYIDDIAIEHKEEMTALALQAMKDGMRAHDIKQRLDATKAYLNNFHHPSKRIEMDVSEQVNITAETREAADRLTPDERLIIQRFEQEVLAQREALIVDAEVIEERLPELMPRESGDV